MFRFVTAASLLALAAPLAAQGWQPEPGEMRSHVGFLASDEMKGREAGSPEYDIAARYVASQFDALGLKPAGGNDSFIQPVPLVTFRVADEGSVELVKGTTATRLDFGVDYLPSGNPAAAEVTKDAPLVFVGFGVVAPSFKRDDYAGLDV